MESLCDQCQLRPASVFMTVITDGKTKTTQLCRECHDPTLPQEVTEHLAALEAATCKYCGGRPCTAGGGSMFTPFGSGHEAGYMCSGCSSERSAYFVRNMSEALRPLVEAPHSMSDKEAAAIMQSLHERADAHMREHVAAMSAAHCRYCGGKPCVSGMDRLVASLAKQPIEGFICVPCAEEYQRSLAAMNETVRVDFMSEHWKPDLAALFEPMEAHMRRWVAERGAA